MEFTVKKNDILDVLGKVQGITNRKSSLAVTANILIESNGSKIAITATDLETGLTGYYPAKIQSKGIIAINAKKFFEIVRDFPNDEIVINEVENQWIEIKNENIEYHIVGMNPDDFPAIPQLEGANFFELDSAAFKNMIEKTVMIGAPSDDKRAHITGIYFEINNREAKNTLRMVSTDGRRLSKVDSPYDSKSDPPPLEQNVIIPKKGLNEVAKFLEPSGSVQIGIKENQFIVKKKNETIIIGLLEGDFPEFEDIITIQGDNIIEMDKKMFLMMLKRMSILSSEDYKGVKFDLTDNRIVITATNPDIGESKEDMDIDYKGKNIEVAFNPRFFIETLNALDSEKVQLNIIDEEHPCLISGKDDQNFLSVIMPMKI